MATSAQQMRAFRGPALFSAGFRPFFGAASLWSAIMVPLWIWIYSGQGQIGGAISVDWHAHEMIFGVIAGVIAGFLLTAVPNWTGRLPVIGFPLAVLSLLWLAGRLVMVLPERTTVFAGLIDSTFLVVFAALIWREVVAGKNTRNLPVAVMVSLIALANILFHCGLAPFSERFSLAVILSLVTLIGGRIIPSFTTNWLKKEGATQLPKPFSGFDRFVMTVTALALVAWVADIPPLLIAGALTLAGILNLWRLLRWCGMATSREPLVWILHVGYAWLAAGLFLLGLAHITPAVPAQAGLHALTAGAIGVMILAVMTRATLGHTGRALHAGGGTVAIYALVNLAAAVRVCAPLFSGIYMTGLVLSSLLWLAAFGGFTLLYGRRLLAPRVGKPA